MSDLIERYGYERAVRELKAMDDRAIWMISSCLKYREEVRKECLEYRRANNIFEVGDKVVHDAHIGDEIYEFVSLLEDIGMATVKSKHMTGGCSLRGLRYATPEEIEAGRRL